MGRGLIGLCFFEHLFNNDRYGIWGLYVCYSISSSQQLFEVSGVSVSL